MELTREQEEQVLKNFYHHHDMCLYDWKVNDYLNHKFQKREGWFYNPENKWMMFIKDGKRWGWHGSGDWELDSANNTAWDLLKPAPEHLVIERVKQELEERGYVEGAKVKCLINGAIESIVHPFDEEDSISDLMRDGEIYAESKGEIVTKLMRNGKWAKIITPSIHDELNALIKRAKEQDMEIEVIFKNK